MKKYRKIRVILAIATTISGCATGGASLSSVHDMDYRHPLFHFSGDFDRRFASHQDWDVQQPRMNPENSTRSRRCITSFNHPLLNRCQEFESSSSGQVALFVPPPGADPLELRLELASRARDMIRKPSFTHDGQRFPRDCSGFILSVLSQMGMDIRQMRGTSHGVGGVARIYFALKDRGMVHKRKVPAIGDLVFFSNTYDRNGDGRSNDPLTHVGIVERVDPDGTVTFIHHVKRGILRYRLNRFRPSERRAGKTRKVLNHFIRVGPTSSAGTKRLTGELFHSFATIIR